MNEIWKDIKGYEGHYQISNLGRVKSLPRKYKWGNGYKETQEKILSTSKRNNGYLCVSLCIDSKKKTHSLHKLVALTFIPNPNSYPCINHKDENKTNNKADNLEWCDSRYNNNYGEHNLKVSQSNKNHKSKSKTVYQYDLEGNLIKIWESTAECGRNGFNFGAVANCCRGIKKTYKNYKWSYRKL